MQDIDGLESMSVQKVPITWFGVAQSIKVTSSSLHGGPIEGQHIGIFCMVDQ
jgi:hypothetical protein